MKVSVLHLFHLLHEATVSFQSTSDPEIQQGIEGHRMTLISYMIAQNAFRQLQMSMPKEVYVEVEKLIALIEKQKSQEEPPDDSPLVA